MPGTQREYLEAQIAELEEKLVHTEKLQEEKAARAEHYLETIDGLQGHIEALKEYLDKLP